MQRGVEVAMIGWEYHKLWKRLEATTATMVGNSTAVVELPADTVLRKKGKEEN